MNKKSYENESILITGGTGTFGSSFIRYLLKNKMFSKIAIYSRDEFKQFILLEDLKREFSEDEVSKLRFFIGDVRDKNRLKMALKGIDYVVHASAMKQVPACEYNPFECIQTNIIGAQNVVEASLDNDIKRVVALSTDKAVSPVNLYGGSKLVSDRLFISGNAYSGKGKTRFSVVRYGNVAASRGSVIPFFKSLIDKNSDFLPITDYQMTRFWIDIEEGIDLVMTALEKSEGGETYISKIPSFKITDLAKAIAPHLPIKEVGIREGEKLHETMISPEDSRRTTSFEKYFIIYPDYNWSHTERIGTPVKLGFEYNSGTNEEWMSVEDIQNKLKKMGYLS